MKQELAPLARIALYVIVGRLIAGGWLPPELQPELVSPAVVEAVIGLGVFAATFVWYWFSQARNALKAAVRRVLR
jgi:hypothetical protein